KPWAEAVSWAAKAALQGRSFGASPVMVYLDFVMPRPKGHLGTGKNAGQVRAGAPGIPTTKPDIDKLARLVLDALTGLAWRDDSQVARLSAAKHWTEPDTEFYATPGV